MADPRCPECDADMIIGVHIRGVYDGILFWVCQMCEFAWSRDWAGYGRRQELADRYVEKHNSRRDRRQSRAGGR